MDEQLRDISAQTRRIWPYAIQASVRSFFCITAVACTVSVCSAAVQRPEKEFYARGIAYAVQGRFEQAKREFQKGLDIDYSFKSPLQTNLDIIERVLDHKVKKEAALHFFNATECANKKQFSRAIKELDATISIEPNSAIFYNSRGVMYLQQANYDHALGDFNQSLALNPRYAKAYLNRGSLYSAQGLFDKALADVTRALAADPRYSEAFYTRGLLYYKNGSIDEAISDYTKAIALSGRYVAAYFDRAVAYAAQAKYDRALSDFNVVIELEPGNSMVYFNKAMVCEKAGHLQEAVEAYKKFSDSAPLEQIDLINYSRTKIRELEKFNTRSPLTVNRTPHIR